MTDAQTYRILVVEDEAHLAAGIKLNLELEGYGVQVASNVRQAREHLLQGERFALIVLDVMLPDMNGMEFCERLRASGNTIPILMLTALGLAEDRVRGLMSGADDYLPKPFQLAELLARVRAQLRRGAWMTGDEKARPEASLQFGKADVDFSRRRATFDGESVSLTKLEFDLLAFFAAHPTRVLSREELHENVWGIQGAISTRTVDNFVLRLRKIFEPDPSNPQFFVSVRGSGYQFLPESAANES
jgi:DNA-binding response OmpR family regulator